MNWINSERPQPEPESEDLKRSIQISQDAFDAITNVILSPLAFLIPGTVDTTVSPMISPIPSPRVYQMFPVTPPLTPSPIPIIIPDPPPIYIYIYHHQYIYHQELQHLHQLEDLHQFARFHQLHIV